MFRIAPPAGLSLRGNRPAILAVLLGFSILSVVFGTLALRRFDDTAGAAQTAPQHWPVSTPLRRSANRPELLVFAHPFCSCTVATLHELAKLPQQAHITVLFYRPSRDSGWDVTKLWDMALALPGARAQWDDSGEEARRFGAETSGYALLYDARGDLLFRGGVTGTRGHEGDNDSLDGLKASLNTGQAAHAPFRVFGCALGNWTRAGAQ